MTRRGLGSAWDLQFCVGDDAVFEEDGDCGDRGFLLYRVTGTYGTVMLTI